jgi:uncharacterized protein YcfJ
MRIACSDHLHPQLRKEELMRTTVAKGTLLAIAAAVLATGCGGTSRLNDGDIDEREGTAIGAAVGAVAGKQIEGGTLGAVIGAVAGGMIGGEIAENELSDEKLASGETVQLRTSGGEMLYVRPVDTFERDGKQCREYELRTEDGGRSERAVACEESPGTWRMASK